MKKIKKGKTIWIALICSLLLHVFFIHYVDDIFERLPIEKTFKKQSVTYIALGQKIKKISPDGNPDIQEYAKLTETQNSKNQDIVGKKLVSKQLFLKKIIPEEITNKVQLIKVDKKENPIFSEIILKPNVKKQTDTLIKEEMTKDILLEENIDESQKLSEEITVKKLQPVKEIHPEKKIVQKQEEEMSVKEGIIQENLPVRFPEENMISRQQISGNSEKKSSSNNLKAEKEIGKENPSEKISSEVINKNKSQDSKLPLEKMKETSIMKENGVIENLMEKTEQEHIDQSHEKQTENIEENGKEMTFKGKKGAIEEILDFSGQLYTDGVAPPTLKEYEKLSYPKFLREREIEGKVMLDVMLNRNGLVEEIKIYQSSGYDAFDKAAIQSVQKWRFMPAVKAGKNMASRVIIPVSFQIK